MSTAFELLDAPEKWCKGAPARDKHGRYTSANDPRAASWCILGAIARVYDKDQTFWDKYNLLLSALEKRRWSKPIGEWNDDPKRTYQDIIDLLHEIEG